MDDPAQIRRLDRAPWHRALPWVPAAVAVLIVGFVLLATDRIVGRELELRATQQVAQSGQLAAGDLSAFVARAAAEVQLLAQRASVADPQAFADESFRTELQRVKRTSPGYAWIGLTDADGRVLVATDGLLEGLSIAQRPVFVQGRQALWFGELHEPLALRQAMLDARLEVPNELADVAAPVLDGEGRLRGVLASHLDGSRIAASLARVAGASDARRGLSLALVSRDGSVLAGSMPSVPASVLGRLAAASGSTAGMARRMPRVVGSDARAYVMAAQPVAMVAPLPDPGWSIVASQPLDEALAPVRSLQRQLLLWGALAALAAGGMGWWVSRRLARPYADMLDAVARQLGPDERARPSAYLEVLTEQLRRLPPTAGGPIDAGGVLALLVHDARRLAAVLDQVPAPLMLLDAQCRVVDWNREAERTFGFTAAEARGRPLDELLASTALAAHAAQLKARPATEEGPWSFEVEVKRRDGSTLPGEWRVSRIRGADGRVVGLIAQVRDLTAQRAADVYRRELSALSQALLARETETSHRMAQALHDRLGQTLTAMRLSHDALRAAAGDSLPTGAVERLDALGSHVAQAIAEVRNTLSELRPPLLAEQGLGAALDNEVRLRRAEGLHVALALDDDTLPGSLRWPPDVERAAFMIAREAIANSLQHARAGTVWLRLRGNAHHLWLQVEDDGSGIDPAARAGRPGHLGIVGMRERAATIGARLDVSAGDDGGTRVELDWRASVGA